MNKIEKILKSKGITAKTKFHNYDYLYNSIKESIEEFGRLAFEAGKNQYWDDGGTGCLEFKYYEYEDFLKEIEDEY